MKIVKVRDFSQDHLLERLRKVSMFKRPGVLPYMNTFISLEQISTEYLAPTQRYLLVDELKKVQNLRWQLQRFGVDMFNLNGYVKIWFDEAEEPIDLLPPVVEESIEADGSVVNIINDGMHRSYLAKMEKIMAPQVAFIRGVFKNTPYYAFPLENGWNDVTLEKEIPEGYLKKYYRSNDNYSLYRDFNSAFDNVGAPRKVVKKD